ncbi:hypothetical protein IQ13_4202 [Lacibacter cauensis]|uniref:Uncharacterized protein n=1 Tax=Lacibacter cauensis TaxID=510947 RepID=A0A562SBE5_9BACT|nr:hypothetical protein [Lacibacter cauensis]TWI77960.1 hypothetical protein IQ13_4202 [Lacibacter cauensis]
MTPAKFHKLEYEEQMLEIFNNAVELAVREDKEHRYHLYKLHDFYVDEIIHKEEYARLAIKTFTSVESVMLRPYLNQIDITKLNS